MPQVLSKRPDVAWALDRSGDQGLKYIIWSIFFVLAFSLSLGEARAADVSGGTTRDALNSAINSATAGDTIVFGPSVNIVFSLSNNAVIVNK
ncbi:MAG: hypothetical protein LBT38_04125, partial [Deltaproteobacteria bacterium]|nr:hypothetical protein [Deltaproteobacteria bacterium]